MQGFFSLRRNAAALRALLQRMGPDARGVAAVEFAVIVPVMLTLYVGLVEVAQGVMVDRKVTQLNRSLADLASQKKTISDADMNNIFAAAQTVMAPFTGVAPRMVINSVVIDSAGRARICWSDNRNASDLGKARGADVTLPDGLNTPNSSLIMARAQYRFMPMMGYVLTGEIMIDGGPIYMRPRIGSVGGNANIEQVERSGKAMCPTF